MHLYHIALQRLVGKELVPLNKLRYESFALYNQAIAKYQGRGELMRVVIPPLNCLWNDVVFLTAVHPSDFGRVFEQAGSSLRKGAFYQIDARTLDRNRLAMLLYEGKDEETRVFRSFSFSDFPKYARIPDGTVEYYRAELAAGRRPLIFHKIPHILYKGSINVAEAPIVEIDQ
jgi:hypothetical protein